MQKAIKYTIFETGWGYFGLAGTEYGLLRTCLPGPMPEKIKGQLLKSLPPVNREPSIGNREPSIGNRESSIEHRESSIEHRESSIKHRVSSIKHRVSRIEFDKTFFKTAQEQIIAYFEGACIDFRNIPVVLDGFTLFARSVLTASRSVEFGCTATYSRLARKTGRSSAARAVGGVMARNPLPLIIPCHRIVRSDGKIGGFSAPGGRDLKTKLLKHEYCVLMNCKSG